MNKFIALFALWTISGFAMAQSVNICDDDGEWAPYNYFERINGKVTKNSTGAVVDILPEIFKLVGLDYAYKMIPWKRCLQFVENNTKYEVFVNGSFNAEREKKYLLSAPIYSTHAGAFYSTKKYPDGPSIKTVTDLNKGHRLCGVLGYNFAMFYGAGLNELKDDGKPRIATGARNNEVALQLVELGRCDFFLSLVEPILGLPAATGNQDAIPQSIDHVVLKEVPATEFYVFISKKSPRRFELAAKISHAIATLRNNGIYEKVFSKYN